MTMMMKFLEDYQNIDLDMPENLRKEKRKEEEKKK